MPFPFFSSSYSNKINITHGQVKQLKSCEKHLIISMGQYWWFMIDILINKNHKSNHLKKLLLCCKFSVYFAFVFKIQYNDKNELKTSETRIIPPLTLLSHCHMWCLFLFLHF